MATATLAATAAQAQIRVVTYNTASNPAASNIYQTIFDTIQQESKQGIAGPIDVLMLQEQTSINTDTQQLVNVLNGLVPGSPYQAGSYLADTNGAGRVTAIYNSDAVQLLGEQGILSPNGNGAAREPVRYQFRPVGYGSEADFFVYNSHYYSSDSGRRLVEAQAIRNNADAQGQGTNIIYAGDFNIDSSNVPEFQELLSAGNGQAFDPANALGVWSNNSAFRSVHTQSPVTSSNFPGQITGGMDDRFDFLLTTDEMLDAEGLAYINGTYRTFGNNGTHSFNGRISTGSGTTPAALYALEQASDHLPVVMDLQVPAVMSSSVSPAPARVLVGANATVDLNVENAANVSASNGADELDYTVTTRGNIGGSQTVDYLTFIADDDASAAADATFNAIKLYENNATPPTNGIDLVGNVAYGGQDGAGTVTVANSGQSIQLEGNRWRAQQVSYNATNQTVVEFEFTGDNEGEYHAIGVDANLSPSPTDLRFTLWGTDTPADSDVFPNDFENYPGSGTVTYTIPLGEYLEFTQADTTADALAGPNTHTLTLDTATAGAKAGTILVDATDTPAVANPTDEHNIQYDVVDHATPSFLAGLPATTLDIDLGVFQQNSGTQQAAFDIFNIESTAGYTAALDLDAINGSGDLATLYTNAATFTNLDAGLGEAFDVFFDTATLGSFASTYQFTLSDEDLLGELTGMTLTLNLTGDVVIPSPASLAVLGTGLVGLLRRRR